ncbi:CoA ester lyase [Alcaligenaceae bacterium]|nr:CoA ester lyase [Alcaligenaceae bacterium]
MRTPARSFLFVPGDSERKLAKAGSASADALILDLEDSVSASNAQAARALAREYLAQHKRGNRPQEIWVRCKPLQDPGALADLAAIVAGDPDGIVVPKVRSGDDLRTLSHYLSALETQAGLQQGSVQILPTLTETPQSLLLAHTFSGEHTRLVGYSWGPVDLMAALGASTNRNPDGAFETLYAYARGVCLLVSGAADVSPIDTICADYRNPGMLRDECTFARQAGFTGKLAIHPDQISIINELFTPTRDEIEHAQRVVDSFANGALGVVGMDGQMLDMPHLRQAQTILRRANLPAQEN